MAEQAARASGAVASTSQDTAARAGRLAGRLVLDLAAVLLGFTLMLPFYWAVISSLKQVYEVRQIPQIPQSLWPAVPQWDNYPTTWGVPNFTNWVGNSLFLTVV